MKLHRLEIPIGMQKGVALLDAEGANQNIDRLAYRHTLAAQEAVIGSRANCQLRIGQRDDIESAHRLFDKRGLPVRQQTLKNLAEDQIANEKPLPSYELAQRPNLEGGAIVEMIHPDRGIDQDHRAFRPSRLSSRLPDQ